MDFMDFTSLNNQFGDLFGVTLFDPQQFISLVIRFFINLLVVGVIARYFYYPRSHRRDYMFIFVLMSQSIFLLVSLMEGTDVDYQRSLQVVVFYNGEYFGIHDLRERLNRSFVETNYGIDSKSINVVKNCSNGDQGCVNGWAPSGTNGASSDEFNQLVNTITNGNFEGENNQSYEQLKEKMNLGRFL